ncbi:MAG: extracellular solute-binding protein [Lachnospiraceae bacterium]|nr:extracellular solute-binding protein [Lachnospiraceae bacterium]
MRKTNKLLATSLVAAMAVSAFAGCSKSGDTTTTTTAGGSSSNTTTAAPVETTEAPASYGEGTITIWVAENVVDFTKEYAQKFINSNEAYKGYTVDVQPVGEGEAASNMITDVQSGADIYGFAQDQLARLVSASAIASLSEADQAWVEAQNDAGAAAAACVGDWAYAYPMTSDNGYFLYYDKSVVTDASTLEGILKQCEDAGKNFYMEVNGGWYNTAFFFGTGCELTYESDTDGNFTKCNVNYASDNGVVAFKEIIDTVASKAFQNGSSVSNATNLAAIVDGTWDANAAKEVFGDNYACAKLPTFTGSDGNTYQMSGFGGFKLLGVKPQEDDLKLAMCNLLAQYLTSEEVQLARYEAVGWGPSNKAAQTSEAVKADEALAALAEQLAFTIPQGQYPDGYWSRATALVDDVITGVITQSTSDSDLMGYLESFQNDCISYAE